jgi:hypothetical protein
MMRTYTMFSSRTKASRMLVEQILDAIVSVDRFEYDAMLGVETHVGGLPPHLIRSFSGIDGKAFTLYEIRPCVFVCVSNGGGIGITRYECRTYAFDRTDFPKDVES